MNLKVGCSSQRATSHRARAPGQLCALALLIVLGCQEQRPAPGLSVASAQQAEQVVRAALDGFVARTPARGLCDDSSEGHARAAAAIGPLRSYQVEHMEPAWVGAEPYFRVDVTLVRALDSERRSVAVRAREGCVERLWGTPLPSTARPEPGELSL